MGLLIRAIGPKTNLFVENVTPKVGKAFSLEELQGFVGGYIEIVQLPRYLVGQKLQDFQFTPKTIMVANEEGLLIPLPFNPIASALVGHSIVGDVVLVEEGVEIT